MKIGMNINIIQHLLFLVLNYNPDILFYYHLNTIISPLIPSISQLYLSTTMTHRPQRFEVYTELQDGSGFRIPNNDHIFLFTKSGGWFDQENNYYNANGDPSQPHSSSQYSSQRSESESHSDDYQHASDDDFYEDIVNQYKYDKNNDYEEYVYNAEELRNMEKIDKNHETLTNYPANKSVRVYYRNMDFNFSADKIKDAYEKHAKILAVEIEKEKNGKNKAEGYFVVANKGEAKKLVELEGKVVVSDRKVYFTVDDIEGIIADPITNNIWKQSSTEKQLIKDTKEKEKQKEKEPSPTKTLLKKQQLKPSSQQLHQKKYRFDISIFQQAQKFKDWMKQFGLEFEKQYKDLKKKTIHQTKQVFALVTMSSEVQKKVNTQKYKGKEVVFTQFKQ